MPIPKTWLEELVYEWLQLKGYFVISNVRLISEKKGGVKEADLIGVRLLREPTTYEGTNIMKEKIEIIHIETGELAQRFEENLKRIRKKFTEDRIKAVENEVLISRVELESVLGMFRLGFSRPEASEIVYKKWYIASYIAKSQINKLRGELKKDDIKFLTFREFLSEVISSIDEWKHRQKEKGLRKTEKITLPENLWLLNLIDVMKSQELLKINDLRLFQHAHHNQEMF